MKEAIRKIVLLICVVVFCVSAFMIAKYFYQSHKAQEGFKKLEVNTLEALHNKNPDTFGWVKIEGTKVDLPVMYAPDRPEFYLRRDFDKKYLLQGVPFIADETDLDNSQDWFIYSHNMKDGTMFGSLIDYDDKGFWEEHSTIELETLRNGKETYKIFAFGKTISTQEGFNVYDYTNIFDEQKYNTFVSEVKKMTKYDTGINPVFGEKLLVLSTCSYHDEDGRYIVVGVKQ